jgi:hypothetical protein
MTKADVMADYVLAQLGSPYVFGARGQKCTPSYRQSRYNACGSAHPTIKTKCQVLTGAKSSCAGCGFSGKLCFDCRGLTYCAAKAAGLELNGAGCTSQWNDADNWDEKGKIAVMPTDEICIVMRADGSTMEHTGLYLGDGTTVEASVNVRQRTLSAGKWTHYGRLPNMDEEGTAVQATVKYGSKGTSVTELQTALAKLGYTVSADGIFGNETQTALKSYQETNGLEADGVCGPITWASINTALGNVTATDTDEDTDDDTDEDTDEDTTLEERVSDLEDRVSALESK